MLLLLRHVGEPENPAIGQLELEHYIARLAGAAFEDEADLEIGLGELARVDVDLDRDVRTLLLGPKRARRVRILEREVLHILRERVEGGSSGGGRAVARRIGHLKKLLGARSLLHAASRRGSASAATRRQCDPSAGRTRGGCWGTRSAQA